MKTYFLFCRYTLSFLVGIRCPEGASVMHTCTKDTGLSWCAALFSSCQAKPEYEEQYCFCFCSLTGISASWRRCEHSQFVYAADSIYVLDVGHAIRNLNASGTHVRAYLYFFSSCAFFHHKLYCFPASSSFLFGFSCKALSSAWFSNVSPRFCVHEYLR